MMTETPEIENRAGRRWTDRGGASALDLLFERTKYLENLVHHEAELRMAAFAAHDAEHRLIAQALAEYKGILAERMQQLNHLREEVLRERGEFVNREAYEQRRDLTDARFQNIERMIWWGVGAISVIGALVEVIIWLVTHGKF